MVIECVIDLLLLLIGFMRTVFACRDSSIWWCKP